MSWTKIAISQKELRLSTVLACGQSFRWTQNSGIWSMSLNGVVLFLRQDEQSIYYKSEPQTTSLAEVVEDYLNLRISLPDLVESWQESDQRANFRLHGVRILRQDPWETLCAFICSSNNNIKRISKMVHSLSTEFGSHIATIDGRSYHDFPRPSQILAPNVEAKLRDLGFGYRSKYIAATAKQIAEKPQGYLEGLRKLSYPEAKKELLQFSGVGPKVADCVCLMALDQNDCVPVDTHIWQIAKRDYRLKFQQNAKGYETVQSYFRQLWGEYAGWAQAVVFAQDLKDFKEVEGEVKKESLGVPLTVTGLKRELDDVKVSEEPLLEPSDSIINGQANTALLLEDEETNKKIIPGMRSGKKQKTEF